MVEQAEYEIISKINDIEIRKYPESIIALTAYSTDTSAFSVLFNYITGANKSREKISMTTPVITSGKIAMTAPVISTKDYMAFYLPKYYSKKTIPIPENSNISIEILPKRVLAVLRFSGRTNKQSIEKHSKLLKKQLEENNIKTKENIFLLRYNSPFTPGFLRRNEVAIEITDYTKE